MKRFIIFAALMVTLCTAALSGERWTRWDEQAALGGTANKLFIPTDISAGAFTPDAISINVANLLTGTAVAEVHIYVPPNSGPVSATDSFVVTVISGLLTEGSTSFAINYYGPCSDTMRIVTSSTTVAHVWGWKY